jgi:hypothetical protein
VPLAEFQRAFAAAIADPELWRTRLVRPDAANTAIAGGYLTSREIARLLHLLQHEGMAANRILQRSTRAMPLHSALPLTFAWLRRETAAVLDAWIAISTDASIQYAREVARFADWLPSFLERTGLRPHPALDALRFERALAALTDTIEARVAAPEVAVVFLHDPDVILGGWRAETALLEKALATHLRLREGNVVLERDDLAT